ncbi:MAG: hypothetical protein HYV24_12205 [Deltaproteobacteria bacterium]|nr:hypothetical protein [Deltaproteobacteria bacterium]
MNEQMEKNMTIEQIERGLPNGFHDAKLKRIDIDYEKREAKLDLQASIGNPESEDEKLRDTYRSCRLILSGFIFCIIEPPDTRYQYKEVSLLWITDSGSVSPAMILTKFPYQLQKGAFVHYFFVNDWNAFIYLSAMDARFEWCE